MMTDEHLTGNDKSDLELAELVGLGNFAPCFTPFHVVLFVSTLGTIAYVAVFGRVASVEIDPPRPIFRPARRSPSPCVLAQGLSIGGSRAWRSSCR
jgi:hypothetical protein